jgi:hypothetical protein
MRRALRPKQRLWIISALLLALVVRALIPAGFMPATDRPFSFEICPDGFPAALLIDSAEDAPFTEQVSDSGAMMPAGHHHGIDGALASAASPHHGMDGALAAHVHHTDGLSASGHNHSDPAHHHSAANTEHCVFAAAAGAFALVFLATLSAPADNLGAPDVPCVSPAFQAHRFRIPQPRGPPALS